MRMNKAQIIKAVAGAKLIAHATGHDIEDVMKCVLSIDHKPPTSERRLAVMPRMSAREAIDRQRAGAVA